MSSCPNIVKVRIMKSDGSGWWRELMLDLNSPVMQFRSDVADLVNASHEMVNLRITRGPNFHLDLGDTNQAGYPIRLHEYNISDGDEFWNCLRRYMKHHWETVKYHWSSFEYYPLEIYPPLVFPDLEQVGIFKEAPVISLSPLEKK